eukprot:PhM_4_TR12410/c0_g1_i1/m.5211
MDDGMSALADTLFGGIDEIEVLASMPREERLDDGADRVVNNNNNNNNVHRHRPVYIRSAAWGKDAEFDDTEEDVVVILLHILLSNGNEQVFCFHNNNNNNN